MITNYDKHWLSNAVYNWKKNYSTLIIWRRFVSTETNLKTGVVFSQYESAKIKAIILPEKIARFDKPTSQFPYGAVVTKGERVLILEQKDLPKTWPVTFQENDRVIVGTKAYTIKDHDNIEGSSIWVLVIVNVKGTPTSGMNIRVSNSHPALGIGQDVTVEKV